MISAAEDDGEGALAGSELIDYLHGIAGARLVDQSTEAVFASTNRSAEDIDVIYKLASSMPAFEKYAEFTRRELCKVMRYCKYDGVAKRVVFFEGDAPDGFYFVLSGVVSGYKKPPDLRANATPGEILTLSHKIFDVKKGQGFGEGAMQRIGGTYAAAGRRGATICCDSPTELLKVELEDYFKILSFNFEKEIEEKVEFLRNRPLFADWSHARLVDIAKCMTIEKLLPNKLVYQQGQDQGNDTSFYVIRSGVCKVIKEMLEPDSGRTLFLHVNTLVEGDHFGEYAILETTRRSTSVFASTKCTLYKLPKPEFDKFITDKTRQRLYDLIEAYPKPDSFLISWAEQQAWVGFKRRFVTATLKGGSSRAAAAAAVAGPSSDAAGTVGRPRRSTPRGTWKR